MGWITGLIAAEDYRQKPVAKHEGIFHQLNCTNADSSSLTQSDDFYWLREKINFKKKENKSSTHNSSRLALSLPNPLFICSLSFSLSLYTSISLSHLKCSINKGGFTGSAGPYIINTVKELSNFHCIDH